MDTTNHFSFVLHGAKFDSLENKDIKEHLLQWNLDSSLTICRFRFLGHFTPSSGEYERLVKDLLLSNEFARHFKMTGSPSVPTSANIDQLSMSVLNVGFFDRLVDSGIVMQSGTIRGCYEETYDGITVGDQLREMLVNDDSENTSLFSDEEKREVIYHIFRILAVGGTMSQPDTVSNRYLDVTRALYKDCLTVYKSSEVDGIQISGRAYNVTKVDGLDLFPCESKFNALIVLVDPIKKFVTIIHKSHRPFW